MIKLLKKLLAHYYAIAACVMQVNISKHSKQSKYPSNVLVL